jgi:SpoVK/Ycf46/Vps4 family AAA+-type ATPase
MMMEYKINLKELKQFYNHFSEIDLSKNSSEDYIMQELRRAFDIKTISVTPRTCSHILIIGAPHTGRTTLAKSFAEYYNLVYISSTALISNEIRKDSLTGKKIK